LGGRYARDNTPNTERRKDLAIDFFRFLREDSRGLERRPTLAELLDWLDYLMPQFVDPTQWNTFAALEPGADPEVELGCPARPNGNTPAVPTAPEAAIAVSGVTIRMRDARMPTRRIEH
jgi:hypothetical protein